MGALSNRNAWMEVIGKLHNTYPKVDNDPDFTGGWLCLLADTKPAQTGYVISDQIGIISMDAVLNVYRLEAQKMASQLLVQNPNRVCSWEGKNPEWVSYGGAIRLFSGEEKFILSFAGKVESFGKAFILALAIKLGLLEIREVEKLLENGSARRSLYLLLS